MKHLLDPIDINLCQPDDRISLDESMRQVRHVSVIVYDDERFSRIHIQVFRDFVTTRRHEQISVRRVGRPVRVLEFTGPWCASY
jgi:hypothetical protein